eukprot:TRINITY_DN3221_c1_g1_i5.p1 TRINITY_DN3221_c1_g1~~TRINITY_DN3221_c1_g1_i5.p1  ORF type:complete len:932 (-),score=260.15 TRINITY_DN3221_c1_g1_i5:314-3109(-)
MGNRWWFTLFLALLLSHTLINISGATAQVAEEDTGDAEEADAAISEKATDGKPETKADTGKVKSDKTSTARVAKPTAATTGTVAKAGPKVTAAAAATQSPVQTKDDITAKGNCSKEIKQYCKDVTPGAAALADCIVKRVKEEKAANDDGPGVSSECKTEVRSFKIEMYKDLSLDKKMETACKKDIAKFCDDDFLYPEPGNILACLREVNQVDRVSDGCKVEIFRAEEDAANDMKLDPQLNELCSSEAAKLCKDVEPGEGRIQDCLRINRNVLAWDCQSELFRQEVEDADDIRLNVKLFRACLNDKKKFCKDVIPGDARVKDCLEDHRLDPDFSPRCKEEFDEMMARRASDFRLDVNLRKYCKSDISEICYPDAEDITDVANWDAKVIQCLQDYREELKDPKCKSQVHVLTKRSAESLRFDKPLADACYADRQTHCKDVPDGMAQVFRCLQDHRDVLKEVCRAAIFEQEVRMAEDIDFKFPMKLACSEELTKFCKDVPQGHAAVINCLQEKLNDADMGEECKKEVKRDEIRSAEDYRLNYRLNKACFNDVHELCLHACDKQLELGSITCGGTVLKCLEDNTDKIESDACKKEVFSFAKKEVTDIRLDVPLQMACKADIAKFCDGSKDHSKTLACLRSKRDELAEECKAEEMRFSVMEASDIRLTPTLMNACGPELQVFCKEVLPSEGKVFKCLQSHLEDVTMGTACKAEVNLKEARHPSNYQLDVRLRKECEADAGRVCAGVDKGQEGHALVLRCMVTNYKKLSTSCATEVSYAVRMALWQYKKGAELTQPCDGDVEKKCHEDEAKNISGVVIGHYGQCLVQQKQSTLDPGCKVLVKVANKDGGYVGGKIDEAKLAETLSKIAELQANAVAAVGGGGGSGLPAGEGLIITGWIAFAAIISLVLVLLGGGYFIYCKYYAPQSPYTLVMKGGDV